MNISELIKELSKYDGSLEIAILDGFNAGGQPRSLNFGPVLFKGKAKFDGDTWADYADLSTEKGKPIVVMGYGCY